LIVSSAKKKEHIYMVHLFRIGNMMTLQLF
jgi:hypothetical protein